MGQASDSPKTTMIACNPFDLIRVGTRAEHGDLFDTRRASNRIELPARIGQSPVMRSTKFAQLLLARIPLEFMGIEKCNCDRCSCHGRVRQQWFRDF
jgi:hypothetical protein